jgi:threonine dehydrogenase-like Zn-dependent dehydrogenase
VPYANFGPRKISDEFKDEEVLFLTDILPTGYTAIDWARLKGGETVAVFGCGPVGLMAQKVAWLKGAGKVIGVDLESYRLEMGRRVANSEKIDLTETDAVEAIRSMTEGRGADVCVDAVGMEADRTSLDKLANVVHLQVGTIKALKMALSAVRRGHANFLACQFRAQNIRKPNQGGFTYAVRTQMRNGDLPTKRFDIRYSRGVLLFPVRQRRKDDR